MTVGAYEELRSEPTHFAVVPGHVVQDVDRVVDSRGGYQVVAKREGEPAGIARATDPRS
jgi:hypothetical protein